MAVPLSPPGQGLRAPASDPGGPALRGLHDPAPAPRPTPAHTRPQPAPVAEAVLGCGPRLRPPQLPMPAPVTHAGPVAGGAAEASCTFRASWHQRSKRQGRRTPLCHPAGGERLLSPQVPAVRGHAARVAAGGSGCPHPADRHRLRRPGGDRRPRRGHPRRRASSGATLDCPGGLPVPAAGGDRRPAHSPALPRGLGRPAATESATLSPSSTQAARSSIHCRMDGAVLSTG